MRIWNSRQGRIKLIIIAVIILAVLIYLNRAYAHIYNTIGRADLQSSDQQGHYLLSPSSQSTSTGILVYSALGDSLTAGVGTTKYQQSYPYLLAQDLTSSGKSVKLYDCAIPGERTRALIKNLLTPTVQDKPNIVTVFIGINDIHGLISPQVFRQNYDLILKTLTTQTKAQIYVINLPYLGAPNLVLFPYNYILNWRTQEFNQIIKQEAIKYQVNYINLYKPTLKLFRGSNKFYAADHFHASPAGYQLWTKIIYAHIHF